MQPTDTPGIPSLFSHITCSEAGYCEALAAPGQLRKHWQAIGFALTETPPDQLRQRQERVKRMRHEDGATYNPFDSPDGKGTPWALEMIPLPLTAWEWQTLATGIEQRAHLLEQIVADVYGQQLLMRQGQLPAELIYANPRFLHTCHGIRPACNRYLTYYAVDCYRGTDGRFRVLRDYSANPIGLGYALENRIVISRLFPELYQKTQIRRLAPFFQTLHTSMVQRSVLRREDPNIVLLSPGPDSPIYFEHALLSRYLGYPLVEGEDLTVRNGKLFLKKLAGLEPVDTVFRHITDQNSDPFALRRDTVSGVAGLIQVAREQNIDITSPIGSGFIETPALAAFLHALCRHLLNEELKLESHPTLWCGTPHLQQQVLADLTSYTIQAACDDSRPLQSLLDELIRQKPFAYIARPPVSPSLTPVWDQDGVQARPTLFRFFACATSEGFTVLPGGLAMTAPDSPTLVAGIPERLQSKDIWVLADAPVEPFSMLNSLHAVEDFRRSSDLPSRVADHLLWLGRYLERAEGLIRLLRSICRRLTSETRPEEIPELDFLLSLLHSASTIPHEAEAPPAAFAQNEIESLVREVLFRTENTESVLVLLKRVQEAARNVRDRLSRDCWQVINRLEEFGDNPDADPLDLLENTLFTLSAFSGLAMESMTRSLGWRFMDMGRRIERGLHQIDLIRLGMPKVCAASQNALEALLEVADSIMTYRARYRTAFQLAPVLDLLLLDESNPKSLAFQFSQLAAHVEHLPHQSERRFSSPEERMTLEMLTAIRLLDLTKLACSSGNAENEEPLIQFLDSLEDKLLHFAQLISAHYLTRVTATSHFSRRFGEDGL